MGVDASPAGFFSTSGSKPITRFTASTDASRLPRGVTTCSTGAGAFLPSSAGACFSLMVKPCKDCSAVSLAFLIVAIASSTATSSAVGARR